MLWMSADYTFKGLEESIVLFSTHYSGNCFPCSHFGWAASIKSSLGKKKTHGNSLMEYRKMIDRDADNFWVPDLAQFVL